jgi:tetratricopeptide (TPR) repeat protein
MAADPGACAQCGRVNLPQAKFCASCGQALRAPSGTLTGTLPVQQMLRGRYRVLGRAGQGGFGAVYRAEDSVLGNRLMAIKEMSQSGLGTQELNEAREAFQREALLLGNLRHPSLPHIYDQFSEDGRFYLVMEFIEGETLEDRLIHAPGRRLAVPEVLEIALQLCDVLEYLHTRQPPIIFRDLKPANVMLPPTGPLFLIDFGIARLFKPGKAKDTMRFGSPGYAPPEQYGQAQTTGQSDIYALGALLHQLLSGIDPSINPFLFSPLPLGTPAGLEPLIMQMVALKMEDRPASIAVIRQELQRIAAAGPQKTRDDWLEAGQRAARAGHFEEALRSFERAIQLDPTLASAQNNKAAALIELKRYQEALAASEHALYLDTHLISARNNKASALLGLKRYSEALRECDLVLQAYPGHAPAHNNRAAALLELHRYAEALAACERAIDLASAYSKQGRALLALKRYDEAARACERAVQLDPQHVRAYLNWGLALLELKRYQEALAAYEQALLLDQTKPAAYAGKGRALNNLRRSQEALVAFDEAIRLAPAQARFYQQRGGALYNLQRYQEALESYEQATRLDPDFALAYADQGDALGKLDRYAYAVAAYERALQLNPQLVHAYLGKSAALESLGLAAEARVARDQAEALRQASGADTTSGRRGAVP